MVLFHRESDGAVKAKSTFKNWNEKTINITGWRPAYDSLSSKEFYNSNSHLAPRKEQYICAAQLIKRKATRVYDIQSVISYRLARGEDGSGFESDT